MHQQQYKLGKKSDRYDEHIKLITPKQVIDKIITNTYTRKAPEGPKQRSNTKTITKKNLINAVFEVTHVPRIWKITEVMMTLKLGKTSNESKPYRTISLLLLIPTLLEK